MYRCGRLRPQKRLCDALCGARAYLAFEVMDVRKVIEECRSEIQQASEDGNEDEVDGAVDGYAR